MVSRGHEHHRAKCTVGDSGLVFVGGVAGLKRLNPIWQRGVTYMTGCETLEQAVNKYNFWLNKKRVIQKNTRFFVLLNMI